MRSPNWGQYVQSWGLLYFIVFLVDLSVLCRPVDRLPLPSGRRRIPFKRLISKDPLTLRRKLARYYPLASLDHELRTN